jgi:uncharacterized membrane protein
VGKVVLAMDSNKKLIISIIILVSFLYTVFTINQIFAKSTSADFCPLAGASECPHKQQLDFLIGAIPLVASIAVIAGALTYYLMAGRIETTQKTLKSNTEVLLKFLSPEERKLVNLLIENNGKIMQAELTRLPGMSKLKSHRTVQKLIDRGVIEKDRLGKTNIVKFTKEIKEGLL